MKYQNYRKAGTLEEAITVLAEEAEHTVLVAGATDIMVKARGRDWYQDKSLLDISEIAELTGIRDEEDQLVIGSMTTIAELLASIAVQRDAELLWLSCRQLGSPQIRNKATIGGNLANACLAADTIVALCVLKAVLMLQGPAGKRELAADKLLRSCPACLGHEEMSVASCFYGDPAGRKNTLRRDEIITAIRIPKLPADYRIRYEKIGRKQAGCMSKFTLAVAMQLQDKRMTDLRLSIGTAFDTITLQEETCRLLMEAYADPGDQDYEEVLQRESCRLGDAIEGQQRSPKESLRYKAEVCRRLLPRMILEMLSEE